MNPNSNTSHYKQGLIHYLYGKGAGKSTSAFGICLRAIGHGMKPIIIQFLKKSTNTGDTKTDLLELKKIQVDISDLITEYGDIIENINNNEKPKINSEEKHKKSKFSKGYNVKGFTYGEQRTFTKFLNIPMIQLGTPSFIFKDQAPTKQHIRLTEFGMKLIERLFITDVYDLIVLDEINTAVSLKLVKLDQLKKLLLQKRRNLEVILTGREGIDELMDISDYVTQMVEEKHPFEKGIYARKGVEF